MRRTAALFAGLRVYEATDVEVTLATSGLSLRTQELHLDNLGTASRYVIRRGVLRSDPTDYALIAGPITAPPVCGGENRRGTRTRR
jgi:hypothetical protein